jgi:FkbM family methyltransferase
MTRYLKNTIKRLLGHYDRRLVWWPPATVTGFDFHADLKHVIGTDNPLCMDVGANLGQTIALLKSVFPAPQIHSFEPSTETFRRLQANPVASDVQLYNYALGREVARRDFLNYMDPLLSSFLELDHGRENPFRGVTLHKSEPVDVRTVDWFVQEHDIASVDLLKIDTQGYDLEVLAGAAQALQEGVVRNVLVEINFVRMYERQSSASEIIDFLKLHGLGLVDHYEKVRMKNALSWCTTLFSRTS